MASPSDSHCGSKESSYCEVCRQTIRLDQYYVHLEGKKHQKRKKARALESKRGADKRGADKGIDIPYGTAFLIEQEGLYNDAVTTYVLSLYKRGALRSRL